MTPSRVSDVLHELLSTRWPAFLWGPPGVGKSSVVAAVAKDLGLDILDVRASLLDPTDLRGIPTVEGGVARWCPPGFLPTEKDSAGVLFFDELNAAPPLVQASLYQLTLDRRVGEYELPEGWRIVAAGNRAEDSSVTFRMPSALANRFIHLGFEADLEDWRLWALDHGVHPVVLGFLATRPELLFNMADTARGFPTPRSWEMVSDIVHTFGRDGNVRDVILGAVGEAASIEFLAYCDQALSEESIRKILENPDKAKLPKTLGDQYALISYVTSRANDRKVRDAAAGLVCRFPPELGVLLLRNILRKHGKFLTHPGIRGFLDEHSELIL